MKIGLVGFPGCGKTTVFNALTGLAAETGARASRSGRGNLGAVKVPDPRVEALAKLFQPKKTTFAEVTFSDLPGGSAGARALDRSAIDAMRDVDALCQVVRAFGRDGEAPDPLREILDLEAETILADLDLVEKRLARLRKERGNPAEIDLLARFQSHLEGNQALRRLALTPEDRARITGYSFLSLLPLLLVLNVDEAAVAQDPPTPLADAARARGLGLVVLSAQVEMEIAQMPPEEQGPFLESLGLASAARDRFVRAAFELCDLVSMLTAGPDECRAWPIPRNTRAQRAAGKIHSDIERGFIRAEVIHWEDLVTLGSEARCRETGKLRIEGKDYIVRDGDVVHFRFNV